MVKSGFKSKFGAVMIAAAVGGMGFAAAPVQASTVNLSYEDGSSAFGDPNWSKNVKYFFNGDEDRSRAGLFRLKDGSGASVLAWCIDLLNVLDLPASHDTDIPSANAAQLENIDKLFTSAYASVNDAHTAAGFQLALWEIMTDTGSADGLDLDNGNFSIIAHSAQKYQLARDYIAGLATAGTGGYDLTTYFNDDSQNLVSGTENNNNVGPVPVPAAGLMLLTGLVGFGAMRRRRKS